MSNSCYIFSPYFLFHCFSQVATNFTFTSENYFILLLLKGLPPNPTKKSVVKSVEHKLEEAFSDGIRHVQLGCFILLSVPVSQQLPRFTSLYFFSFLTWPVNYDCIFRRQNSEGFEQLTTLENWKFFSLQVTNYRAAFMQNSPWLSTH